ncbi:MAG: CheR family methyltransferase [Terracidiphilus sp.]
METAPAASYGFLRQLVFGVTQNVLDPSRDYLFDTRLRKILRNCGMNHVEELVLQLKLRPDRQLERAIAEAMTINETTFFRDALPFDLLRAELLPKIIESRRAVRSLRFWSAASSTGQEAYSMAMLLAEHFPVLAGWRLRIEGTDICGEAVERAKTGRYHRIEINRGLPARLLVRYFDHAGEYWTVKPAVHKLCQFRQANLCGPQFPFSRRDDRFDAILLRNVMLYFSLDTRRTLLDSIHRVLAPDGILFLGASEQPPDLGPWTPVLTGGTCYYKPRRPS